MENEVEYDSNQLIEISTWGGCSSRAIFNEKFTPGYKKVFHINFSAEGASLVSLMSKPVEFDRDLLNSPYKFSNTCVENDFSKRFLIFLKKDSIDYLLMDTSFDLVNVLLLSNGSYVSDTARLRRNDLYNTLDIEKKVLVKNFDQFFELWKQSCDLFFDFIKDNCPNLNVILNGSRWAYKYYDGETLVIDNELKKKSINRNHLRDLLDKHILENHDVEYLSFNKNTLIDKNHIFGFNPEHYDSNYYSEKLKQLTEIVNRNKVLESFGDINNNYKKLIRENAILSIDNSHNLNYDEKINSALTNYITGRIDIKNSGNESNSIEIQSISDDNPKIFWPKWFKNELGNGVIVESSKGSLDLRFKCINDGKLRIALRGISILDKNRKRFPIHIDFLKFSVNNEELLKKNRLVWHNRPYIFDKDVIDGEIINVHLEWQPFTMSSTYIL